ncbi:MAG: hypothetical protein COA69_09540 [Robiginitomaculum sp.]|nr:MAG: hypothetical protein COA69_09540 [Robiginitomaculum sp.]
MRTSKESKSLKKDMRNADILRWLGNAAFLLVIIASMYLIVTGFSMSIGDQDDERVHESTEEQDD